MGRRIHRGCGWKLFHFEKVFEYCQVFPELFLHPSFQNALVHVLEIHHPDSHGYVNPCAVANRPESVSGLHIQGAGERLESVFRVGT